MEPLRTTIYLAPSGTGKTTSLRQLKHEGMEFTHINRDGITSRLIEEYRQNAELCSRTPNPDHEQINALLRTGNDIYRLQLAMGIAENTPHIVIDYPPSGHGNGWALKAAQLSQRAGRVVTLEGITANPEITLPRVLSRNTVGMDLATETPDMMAQDGRTFRSWLTSYKNFPDQFLKAAKIADVARLHDNNGNQKRLIAEWQKGEPRIYDERAYGEFLRLRDVNPEAASFEARLLTSELKRGKAHHTFETKPSRFFGADNPTTQGRTPTVPARPTQV